MIMVLLVFENSSKSLALGKRKFPTFLVEKKNWQNYGERIHLET